MVTARRLMITAVRLLMINAMRCSIHKTFELRLRMLIRWFSSPCQRVESPAHCPLNYNEAIWFRNRR